MFLSSHDADYYTDDEEASDFSAQIMSGIGVPDRLLTDGFASKNVSILGVMYELITDAEKMLALSLSIKEGCALDFVVKYYSICISINPVSVYADSRYSACWDAARWISSSLKGEAPLIGVSWIESLYVGAPDEVKRAIETGLLEHLPATAQVLELFGDWVENPELYKALLESGVIREASA